MECKEGKAGGEGSAVTAETELNVTGGTEVTANATTVSAGACAVLSAFTNCCRFWVSQPGVADFVLWQHWCAFTVRRACGQEKQFPQNMATTTKAAMTELEKVRIEIRL